MKKIRFNSAIITSLLLLFSICTQAQKSKIGTWKTYPAYQDAVLVAETPNRIFGVYKGFYNDGKESEHNDGSLFSYSPEDKEIITYSFADGLSDFGITQMAYAPEAKVLVLIYENSNIDLFYGRNNVVNISSVKDNFPQYTNKAINNIEIIGKLAYLSTGFGVVVLDLERHEIKSEYSLKMNTSAFCQVDDYFYIATSEGMKRALVSSSNLKDISNWESVDLKYEGDARKITKMTVFNNQLVFSDSSKNRIYYRTKDGSVKLLCDAYCVQLAVLNEQLVVLAYKAILFYTDLDSKKGVLLNIAANSISSNNSKNIFWIAQHNIDGVYPNQQTGMVGIKRAAGEANYEVVASGITINSPLRNYNDYMTYAAGKLLVVGGNRDYDGFSRILGTFMIFEDGKWTNFDDMAIAKQTGLTYYNRPFCRRFVWAAVDPSDSKHYFVSSYGEGVYEFQDTTLVKLHSYQNTNNVLNTNIPDAYPELYVLADGLTFDKKNNLYVINAGAQGICMMTPDHQWKSFSYPPLVGYVPKQILIAKNNLKWVNVYKGRGAGIFVLNDNNTIDNISDDAYYFSASFVDQQGIDVNASQYWCMAEDLNGTIWVGTDNGPISFSSADQIRRGVCNRIILSDQYEQGYRPLEGTFITAIAVDGANRKWMGSRGEGIFVLDASGETTKIENFTTSNSDLISNEIYSITINNKTGEVFIGTDRGIVSYMSDVVEGMSDYSNVYAYPNPVKPESNNQVVVTGLMANSTIKITDVAGNLINQGVSKGGQYTWNCTNRTGNIVKAGIYLVLASRPDGSQGVVTKIMVIK